MMKAVSGSKSPYFSNNKISFNAIFLPICRLLKWYFLSGFSIKILNDGLVSMLCPTHTILIDPITVIVTGKELGIKVHVATSNWTRSLFCY